MTCCRSQSGICQGLMLQQLPQTVPQGCGCRTPLCCGCSQGVMLVLWVLRHKGWLHWVAQDSNRCLQMVRAVPQWEGCHHGGVLCNARTGTSPGAVLGCYHQRRSQLYLGHGGNQAVPCSCVSKQCWLSAGCSDPRGSPTASCCPALQYA